MVKIIQTRRLLNLGNSWIITLPKRIMRKRFELGDLVEVEIRKIKNE